MPRAPGSSRAVRSSARVERHLAARSWRSPAPARAWEAHEALPQEEAYEDVLDDDGRLCTGAIEAVIERDHASVSTAVPSPIRDA